MNEAIQPDDNKIMTNGQNDLFRDRANGDGIGKKEKLALYSRSIAMSTSQGLVGPFVSMLAIRNMNATGAALGWLQSMANLLSTFLNPVFGRMSDILKKRIPFIVVSTIAWGIPYIFLYWAQSPLAVILIVALVNLLLSLGSSSWTALQNELFPPNVRAKLSSKVFWYNAVGSIVATFFTGMLLTYVFNDTDYQKYILIPIFVGIGLSIIGVLPFNKIKEPLAYKDKEEQPITRKLSESFKIAYRNKPFRKFTAYSMVYSFFWSFAWPLFPVKQINILNANAMQIASLQVLFSLTTLLFVTFGAKLSDSIGRTKLIFFNRISMATFPFLYVLARNIWDLYIVHFVISAFVTIGMPSVQAYLLDMVPEREGGIYFGIYNMITGLFLFLGSLISGYVLDLLTKTTGQLIIALNICLIVASSGRALSSLLFLNIKEQKKFPYKFGQLAQLIRERKLKQY